MPVLIALFDLGFEAALQISKVLVFDASRERIINNMQDVIFSELLSKWQQYTHLTVPASSRVILWEQNRCSISIGSEWGPAVPYAAVDHGDGHQNHGYVSLKGNPDLINQIPEVIGWSELSRFLEIINAPTSPIESAGCEKHFFPDVREGSDAVLLLGSYVDVFFSDTRLNDSPKNLLLLASHLMPAVIECHCWWATVTLELTRFRFIRGTTLPWGLQIHVTNHGRTEEQARQFWGETLRMLGDAVSGLSSDLRWSDPQI